MIPTMMFAGLIIGLVPRWWPGNLAVVGVLSLLLSFAFGFAVGEPIAGTVLAVVNTAIGVALGRLLQLAVPSPKRRRRNGPLALR